MNRTDAILLGVCGIAIVGIVGWMVLLSVRLRNIERAVQSIAANTNSLRDLVGLLKSVEGNTSLFGGIGSVFGSKDRKKPG
jgi:hypothetical protein